MSRVELPLQAFRHAGAPRPQAVDDRLAIDGVGERAANQRICQQRVVLVEHGQAVVGDRPALHLEGGVLLDRRDLVRRDVAGELVFAGQQPVDAARHFRHFDKADALQRRPAAPILVVRLQRQRHVGAQLDDLVRTGRDRLARPVEIARRFLPCAPAHDVGARTCKTPLKRDVRRRVVEAHRVFIDGIDAQQIRPHAARDGRNFQRQLLARPRRRNLLERLDRRAVLRLGGAEHALAAEAEHDVLGRHLVAVVELDALAKLQLDRLLVDPLPFGREARHGLQAPAPVPR